MNFNTNDKQSRLSFFSIWKSKIEKTSDKQIAFTFLIIAFFLRAIYAVFYYFIHYPPESYLYYRIAELILDQGKIFYNTANSYQDVVGPVLPWLNAATMLIFGKNYLGLYIITALGSALITFYTYKTARMFLDKTTSLIIGFWSLFYFFYFYFTPNPGKDIWMAFFMIYLIYQLIKLFVKKVFTYPSFLLFILMYVVSIHLDERYVIFSPFIFFYILYSETESFKKLHVKISLLFIGFVMLFMLPWAIRNYNKYDKIVILSTRTEPYTDKFLGYGPKDVYFSDDFTSIKGTYYIHDYQIDSVISRKKTITDAGYKIREEWANAMKKGILPEPLTGIRAFASRIRTMFEPFQLKGRFERTGYYYYNISFRHNMANFLFYGILFFFSFPGSYYLYKLNKPIFIIFISTIVIYALLHALTIPYTNWRYRLPLDAIFIIVGGLGINVVFKKFLQKISLKLK